jgi:CheY-like chemotaxis protein
MSKKKVVLVVDDEESFRKLLVQILAADDLEILEAKNGEEALAVCNMMRVDFVLTDIFMQKMDGIDLNKQLKLTNPEIEVFFTSAVYPPHASDFDIPKTRFIEKNPNLKAFAKKVTEVLQANSKKAGI